MKRLFSYPFIVIILASCIPPQKITLGSTTTISPLSIIDPIQSTVVPQSSPPPLRNINPAIPGMIVFYSERDGNSEIYTMNSDGSNQQRLTYNTAQDFSPAFSPDGNSIAFVSDRDDSRSGFCSPNCNYNLYVMNMDGSNVRRVTNLPGAEWDPDWSPDGEFIAFTGGGIGFKEPGIYQVNLESGQLQPILVDEFDNEASDWSPDGKQIAFSSDRDGNLDIYIMNPDASHIQKIADTGMNDYWPDWSPDGQQLTFFAANLPLTKQDVFIVDIDGNDLVNLTNTPEIVDEDPVWTPDGRQIVFQSDRDGNYEIYVMNSDGSQPYNLSRNSGQDYWPDWSMLVVKEIAIVSDHEDNP